MTHKPWINTKRILFITLTLPRVSTLKNSLQKIQTTSSDDAAARGEAIEKKKSVPTETKRSTLKCFWSGYGSKQVKTKKCTSLGWLTHFERFFRVIGGIRAQGFDNLNTSWLMTHTNTMWLFILSEAHKYTQIEIKILFLSIQNHPKICGVLAEEPKVSQSSRRVVAWERTSKWTIFMSPKQCLTWLLVLVNPWKVLLFAKINLQGMFQNNDAHFLWRIPCRKNAPKMSDFRMRTFNCMKKYWKMIFLTFQEMLCHLAWLKARKAFNLFQLSSPRTTSPNNLFF